MKVAIGSDHGGFELKEVIVNHLISKGYDVLDVGTKDTSSCDYPIYGEKVANEVASDNVDCGIVICGTGIGISLAANKVKGIRCALAGDCFSAKMAKMHNNANMLAIGARVTGVGLALDIVDEYLNATFEAGRHERRVALITDIEDRN